MANARICISSYGGAYLVDKFEDDENEIFLLMPFVNCLLIDHYS